MAIMISTNRMIKKEWMSEGGLWTLFSCMIACLKDYGCRKIYLRIERVYGLGRLKKNGEDVRV